VVSILRGAIGPSGAFVRVRGEKKVGKAAGDEGAIDGLKGNEWRHNDDGTGRRDGRVHFGAPLVDGGDCDGSGRLAQWNFAGTPGGTVVFIFGKSGF
jgi:hypothetical protein